MTRPPAVGTRQACPPQGGGYPSAASAPRASTLLDIFNATAVRLAIDAIDATLKYPPAVQVSTRVRGPAETDAGLTAVSPRALTMCA